MDVEKEFSTHVKETCPPLTAVESRYIDNYHGIRLKTVSVYAALCLIYFTQLFHIVGSGANARNIVADIGGSDKTVWFSQAIVIVTVVLGPPASQAADYWGRKWFLVIACIFGFIGSLIFATATSFNQAIAGQVIASVMYTSQPILIAVASEIFPRKFRPAAQAGLNFSGATGAIVGLLGGSSLIDSHPGGWRDYWYIIGALVGVSAIIVSLLYNPPLRPLQKALTTPEKLAHLDWTAYIFLAAGLTLFTMGLSWAENPYPWSNARVITCLAVGGLFMTALFVHQRLIKDGLINHELFRGDRNFVLALGCFFADGMVFWAANNYYSYQLSVLYEMSAFSVALHYTIAFCAAVIAALSVTLIQKFTKTIREPIIVSFALYLIFNVLMALTSLTSTIAVWIYPVLLGVGLGWSLTYLVTAAQLSTPPHLITVTSGILLAVRSFGGSIALAIFTAIFNSSLSHKLGNGIAAAVIPLGLPPAELEQFIEALVSNNRVALLSIRGITPQIIFAGVHALRTAFLESFRRVWIAAAVFSGVATFASCFMLNPVKDLNNHVDAPLEE